LFAFGVMRSGKLLRCRRAFTETREYHAHNNVVNQE